MDIFKIVQGFINSTKNEFGVGDPDVERKAIYRYSQCVKCPLLSKDGNRCDKKKVGQAVKDFKYNKEQRYKGNDYKGCNCLLGWLTRSDGQCVLGKW